jgi:hypothetical protein
MEEESKTDFLLYSGDDGKIKVGIIVDKERETIWTSQRNMAEIFGVEIPTINYHVKEIFKTGELKEVGTIRKILIVQKEGERNVEREIDFYNLDAIIAVGYRVNSYQATQFRMWATKTLKEYLIKGFALDDERLKQGKTLFGKDYFDELLGRIKEIRASERRFYQKITDIYASCSADYDVHSPITQTFFATVQNKLEFAITHMTAGGIVKSRANYKLPNMGLTTWKNAPGGKVLKADVSIAKNYLDKKEIDELNSIVVMYLDYAELQAKRNKIMKMSDWVEKLDAFLKFNEYDILTDAGRVKSSVAKTFAEKQYEKFRVIQDKEYKSDFDKVVDAIKTKGKLPTKKEIEEITKEEPKEELTQFNKDLTQALNYNPKDKEK